MHKISIISPSIREERKSHRAALYFSNYIKVNNFGETDILDLREYQFPIFEERLKYMVSPETNILEFAHKVKDSDGIIMIVPEYNGSYPASLKNVIDLLNDEWYHKPVAIAGVSGGAFGGSQAIPAVQSVLWKMKALTVTATFPVPFVEKSFDAEGNATSKEDMDKRAGVFIKELLKTINKSA